MVFELTIELVEDCSRKKVDNFLLRDDTDQVDSVIYCNC